MESRLQNPEETVRTTSNVLRTDQLPRHLPTNHEPDVQRNEDAIPNGTIRLYGRHPHCNNRRPDAPPTNCPPSPGQTRGRILLPLTRQMRIRERKDRLPKSHHQSRKDPYRPPQSRRTEELATETQYPKTSTINTRNFRLPKTIYPRVCSHRATTHQSPEKGDELPMDKCSQRSCGETNQHHPQQPHPLPPRPP